MRNILLVLAVLFSCTLSAQYRHIHLQEDFNDTIMPVGWSTNAVSGTATWSIGVDGSVTNAGNNNLNGTPMAYFDDDAFGSAQTNNTAQLITSAFDNSSFPTTRLSFDYNFRQFNGPLDSFKVEVFDGSAWATVFSQINNDCGNWLGACVGNFPKASIDITNYSNANCQVRFTYFDGNDWCWYVGIDNVVIDSEIPLDIGIVELNSPVTSCALISNEQVQISIANYGTDTISNFSVRCDINNGQVTLLDTVNTVLFPSDTMIYSFKTTVDFSNTGIYSFDLLTTLIGDSILFNDSLSVQIQSDSIYAIPRFENFEMQNGWSTNGVNSSWQLGVPKGVQIDSAFSDSLAFVTNLGGSHNNNELSYLYSPCYDLSQISGVPSLTFKMNYDLEINGDNLIMESSTDAGMTWNRVNSEFGSSNWYALNGVWEGNSAGWIEVKNTLPSLQGNQIVKFRFRFESNGSVVTEGVGIDDFSLSSSDSVGIAIVNLVNPSVGAANNCGLGNEHIVVSVQNEGSNIVDTVFLFYRINGGTVVQDTVVKELTANETSVYSLKKKYNFSALAQYTIDVWAKVNGDTYAVNDSLLNTVIQNTKNSIIYSMPYEETFSLPNFVPLAATGAHGTIDSNWTRTTTTPFYNWKVANSGNGTFPGSGPIYDHTGNGSSFIYASSTRGVLNEIITLESPCIDLTNGNRAIEFEYWYHRFGSQMNPLYVDVLTDTIWQTIDIVNARPQLYPTFPWSRQVVELDTFQGRKIKIRYRGLSTSACCDGEMAIDDLSIYNLAQFDLEVIEINSPSASCNPTDSVDITIVNNGSENIIGSIPIAYQIDGSAVAVDTLLLTQPLNRGNQISFEFISMINLNNQNSNYLLKVWTNYASDSRKENDTLVKVIYNAKVNQNNSFENFDSFSDGSCINSSNSNIYDILKDGWLEKSKGDFKWHVQNGLNCAGTVSSNTGPLLDHTNGMGNFIFTEATGIFTPNVSAILESPCIDFTNSTSMGMRFWYHRYGNNMGSLYIDVFANGVWNMNVDSLIGQSHVSSVDPWKLKKVAFNQFAGQVIKVRFRAIYGGGFEGDMAIDDVQFYSPIQQDAQMLDIDLLQASCEQDSAQLLLTVNNFGLDSILPNRLKVKYQINNSAVVIDSNAIGLKVDSNLTFSLNVSNIYNFNNQRITAWVELPNDSNSFNDTLFYDIDLPSRSPEYIEGFENIVPSNGFCGNYNTPLNLAWETDLNDQWVAGHDTICSYGARGATPTASTGPDSAYAGYGFMYFEPGYNSVLDTAVLTSTCIDLRNDSISYLDFYYHMYGAGTGKLYIDVIANGVSTRLDSIVGQQHFSINDPWSLKMLNLNQFAGDIIRIQFTAIESTNTSISDQGNISIDNVRISNSFPVSVVEAENKVQTLQLFPNPTKGEFILRGNGYSTSELVLNVMDLNGRVIESRVLNPTSSSINERFDLSNQANGVYLISIQSEGKVEVKKVVLSGN